MEGVSPEELADYYGVHGPTQGRRRGQTGAGHPQDENDSSDSSDDEPNEEEEESVEVDESHSPFDEHYLALFWDAL